MRKLEATKENTYIQQKYAPLRLHTNTLLYKHPHTGAVAFLADLLVVTDAQMQHLVQQQEGSGAGESGLMRPNPKDLLGFPLFEL